MALKILHLEDNASDAELVKHALRRARVDCEIENVDSADAYERALSRQVHDVILSDSGIPGYDGRAALRRALEGRPGVPFIVVSGNVDGMPAEFPHEPQPTARVSKARLDSLPDVIKTSIQRGKTARVADSPSVAREPGNLIAELESRVAQRTSALQECQLELEAVNGELEAFSYSIAHDLQSPLLTIDGFAELLVETCGETLSGEGLEYLGRMRTATVRMQGLINDLVALSQIVRAPMNPIEVNLAVMIGDIAVELQHRTPDRQVRFLADDAAARGDPGLIRIVLEQLLTNAWKFTSKTPAASIRFGVAERGERMTTFFLRDNGAGFDPRYASKLFSPFHRLHTQEQFPGSGVGLATVRRIVHRHGGKIYAEGAINEGATFYFSLPTGTRSDSR